MSDEVQDILIGGTLDRSWSMNSVWRDAEQNFNRFKNEQAALPGNAWMILHAFDDEVDLVYRAWNCRDIPDLPEIHPDAEWPGGALKPRHNTALYDAIAKTILETDRWLAENYWFVGKVLQVVVTDGEENSSREFKAEHVKHMIAAREEKGWVFVYLGANVDAWDEGGKIGVAAGATMQYQPDSAGIRIAYSNLSAATTRLRTDAATMSGGFFEEEEQEAGGDENPNTGTATPQNTGWIDSHGFVHPRTNKPGGRSKQ